MKHLRIGGMISSFVMIFLSSAFQLNALTEPALWVCVASQLVGVMELPARRISSFFMSLCLLFSGRALLLQQSDTPYFVTEINDKLISAGSSAYRTLGLALFLLLMGIALGEMLMEAALGQSEHCSNRAALSVRSCASFLFFVGLTASLAPGLSEWIPLPERALTGIALLTSLAIPAALCCCVSSRSTLFSGIVIVLTLLCSVFDTALFGRHALCACFLSVIMCARSETRLSLFSLLPVALLFAIIRLFPESEGAFSVYAQRLGNALHAAFTPGAPKWLIPLYGKFGLPGLAAAGLLSGALFFLLGKMLRETLLFSLPSGALLLWGGIYLLRGTEGLLSISEGLALSTVFSLCLIVGCIRRSSEKKARRR